uniref:Uncharacterized protein n=1 Tax=Plectus sambesii TaxID=2011161 RepID=A0A914VJV7_9BILA
MLFIPKGFQWISFIFALALHCSASRSNPPKACLYGNSTEALSIVELFDRLVLSGPSYGILSELMTFFETRHDHEQNRQNQSECANEIFLSIDNKFVGLDVTIRSLHAMGDLKTSLIETRQTINNVRKVYFALNLYERQKEPASRDDAVNQCKEFHPRNSLIELKSHVTTPPKLFEEILDGTRYSQVEFEEISEVWLKEAGLCVLLMQACEKLEYANASAALQNARLELASKMLQDIYEMLLDARKKLKVDFKNVVPDDILTILSKINAKKMSGTRVGCLYAD